MFFFFVNFERFWKPTENHSHVYALKYVYVLSLDCTDVPSLAQTDNHFNTQSQDSPLRCSTVGIPG